MEFFENFLAILFFTLWIMIVVAFFIVVIRIIVDIFRDQDLGGWGKTGWVAFVVLLPILGSIVYLFARGKGMAMRDAQDAKVAREAQIEYTKGLMSEAGGSASEIKAAKELLDSGAITEEEFAALKAKALA